MEKIMKKAVKPEVSFWQIIQPFIVYYLGYLAATVILTYLVSSILLKTGVSESPFYEQYEATINGILSGFAMLAAILPLFKSFRLEIKEAKEEKEIKESKETKEIKEVKEMKKKSHNLQAQNSLQTILLSVSASLALNILFELFHLTDASTAYTEVAAKQYGVMFGAGLILYGLVSPLAEEIVFRGLIFNRMKKVFSKPMAIVLSGLLFGVYHGNLIQGIYGFLIGMLLAYVYERFGSFFYAFLLHGTANIVVYVITMQEKWYSNLITRVNGILFILVFIGTVVWVEISAKRK